MLCKRGLFFVLFCLFPYLEFGDLASPPGPSAMFWWLNCSVWRHLLSICDLWLMREHEFSWEIYFNLIFFPSWVSHMFYSVLPNVKILSFASLWRVNAIGGIKFLNQKVKFLHPFSYMCSPKLRTENSFSFFPFLYGNVLKEIQNILECMNIVD